MQSVGDFEFSQGDLLGHGAFALVFKGRKKMDHCIVAVKQIALKSVPGKLSNIRQKEVAILKDLKNPHIVKLYDYLETPSDIFLVMEYCNGGDMGDYLIAKKTLSESSIRHLCRHIALALQTLSDLHIIHRDIKPQNLLLSYPPSSSSSSSFASSFHSLHAKSAFTDSTVKLADFGFARYLNGADMAATLCGSPLYMAPEILMGQRYDSSADLWSVGTILFQCLSGSAPFLASNPHALRRRYQREKLLPKVPEGTSHHLGGLLMKLLRKSPRERMSYSDFFRHDFLKDPSSFSSDPMLVFHPSQAVKSSPVPIKRQLDHPHSSYRQSISPHRGSSIDVSSFSPSSGPPLSHRVGSQASLPYYSAQSPNTEVTDQGFVLVDFPGRPNSRRCSLSSTGSGNHTSGRSSGRNSVPGHTHSGHTPSSASGSLSRYTSLTTPFYQPHSPRQGAKQSPDMSATPVNKTVKPPRSHSGTNHLGSFGSIPGQLGPSPPGLIPFGQLVPHQQPTSAAAYGSPVSNINACSNSYHSNRVSPTPSPLSTPPSSSPGAHHAGTKGSLARRNSGTKLSALTEERERKKKPAKSAGTGTPTVKQTSGGFDIISHSCLLGFSDDDDEDNGLELEEDNFPVGLTTSLSSSLSVDQEDADRKEAEPNYVANMKGAEPHYIADRKWHGITDRKGVEPHTADRKWVELQGLTVTALQSSGDTLQFVRPDAVHFTPARPASSAGSRNENGTKPSGGMKRASSFSYQRNPRLSQQLASLHSRASSLSVHSDPLDPHAGTPHSAEITAFKVPFLFPGPGTDPDSQSSVPGSNPGADPNSQRSVPVVNRNSQSSMPGASLGADHPNSQSSVPGSNRTSGVVATTGNIGTPLSGRERSDAGEDVEVWFGPLNLTGMVESLVVVRELHAMAKARQGPILLMSTSADLNDSGIAGRQQRCSEQVVLYAKSIKMLDTVSTCYGMELATNYDEPPQQMKKVAEQAKTLRESGLQEAKQLRQEMLSSKENGWNSEEVQIQVQTRVSAEKLLFMEALDMCKIALLDETSSEALECIKRYKRAKILFQHLLSEAETQRDKLILQKYTHSAQARIMHLLS